MRTVTALLLALVAVALAMPGEWAAQARATLRCGWPAMTVVLSLLLALAGRLLPDLQLRAARADYTGLTVGLLLLLEPLLHLSLLGICALVANPFATEALLPTAWTPPTITSGFALRLLIYTAITPICEEFFFRGRLLPWLRGHFGAVSALSISSLAFAVAHGDLMQVAIALPVGLLLGTMRLAGADLSACMLAHAVHNALFLIAGPALIGLPLAAPLLAAGGLLLTVIAWFYHHRPHPRQLHQALAAVGFGAVLLTASAPFYRHLTDRWWVAGVQRLCQHWRVANEQLFARLLVQERNRRLTEARRDLLVAALATDPCQASPRQTGLLALLAPDRELTGDTWEDDAAMLLDELASTTVPSAANGELARRLGRRFPSAFADAVLEYPEALRRWLPLPERVIEGAMQVQCTTEPRDRRILLTALERIFPGAVAAVIHSLPPAALTPLDQRHLRLHYGEGD